MGRRRARHFGRWASGCAVVVIGGCYQGVGDGDAVADDTGAASTGAAPTTDGATDDGADSGSGDTGEGLSCDAPSVGHMPLRRLTRVQYANAVRDLFGVEANIATLGGDEKIGPFDANYAAPVSPTTVDQFRALAEDVALQASTQLATLLPCDPAVDAACLDGWIDTIGRRVYRRPLTADEHARYTTLLALGEDDPTRVQLVVQAMLQSPNFWYQLELSMPDPQGDVIALAPGELASRMAFFLWNSVPDDTLLDAAEAGELDTPDGIRMHAARLLDDPRARATVEDFHAQWLAVDKLVLSTKDPLVYPAFDEDVRAAMAAETRRFASRVVFDGDARLETLLTSNETWIDAPLFEIYGLPVPVDHDPNTPVQLDPDQRAGLLTQAGFLAAHAHASTSGPIQRGVVVRSNLLCDPPPPPPPDINVIPPDPDPDATTRELFEMHTSDPSCAGCHSLIDGVGLGFEGYDGIGMYRDVENGITVDQSGEVVGTDVAGPFVGAVELAHKLAGSQQVRDCVATQWFRFALGRFEGEADACTLQDLRAEFADSDYDVRALMVALVTTDAFRYRAL